MKESHIHHGRRITSSTETVKILGTETNLPKGHRLILGDMARVAP